MKDKTKAKKFVSSDGVDIYYWPNLNKSTKKRFILLHPGAAANHSSLEEIEHGLNKLGYPTLNFDPRGSGYSDAPISREYYQLDRVTGDLEGIIKQEGLEKPILIGHSWGFMPMVDYTVRTGNSKKIIGIGASYNFSETAPKILSSKLAFNFFDKFLIYLDYVLSIGTLISHKLTETERHNLFVN